MAFSMKRIRKIRDQLHCEDIFSPSIITSLCRVKQDHQPAGLGDDRADDRVCVFSFEFEGNGFAREVGGDEIDDPFGPFDRSHFTVDPIPEVGLGGDVLGQSILLQGNPRNELCPLVTMSSSIPRQTVFPAPLGPRTDKNREGVPRSVTTLDISAGA